MRGSSLGRGQHFSRQVVTASKEHKCYATCGASIPSGVSYVRDRVTETIGFGRSSTRTLMVLAWHLACAPEDPVLAKHEIASAIDNAVKHPSHTGAEYEDA